MISRVRVKQEDRQLLWNIHQKYLYEMTNYYDNEMDENGNYHYGWFDAYFIEPERQAFFIYSADKLAGFAMINPYSYINENPDYVMAEFTIFPAFRGRGLAAESAERILTAFGGSWEIKYNEKNTAAKCLWNKVTAKYNPQRHRYSDFETVLSFAVSENAGK